MTTGINKLAIVGTIIAALVIVAPAAARLELPDGYAPPSTEPTGYSPQALRALGERSQAMATFYSQSTGLSQFEQAGLRNLGDGVFDELGRLRPDVIGQPVRANIAIDSVGRTTGSGTGNSGVASDESFDWSNFGIAAGSAALLVALLGAGLIGVRARGHVAHP